MKKAIMKTELLCKSFVSDGEVTNVLKNISLDIYESDFTVIMEVQDQENLHCYICLVVWIV